MTITTMAADYSDGSWARVQTMQKAEEALRRAYQWLDWLNAMEDAQKATS